MFNKNEGIEFMKKTFKNFPSLGRGLRGEGFTLAEVLITLMIIGIVAALTIPSVISNYQQQEFKTGLKKAVSVLNEAIQTNIAMDGETPYENSNLFLYLQKHMNILNTRELYSCYDNNGNIAKNKDNGCQGTSENGENWMNPGEKNVAFYTTDGMRFEVIVHTAIQGRKSNLRLHETGEYIGINEGGYYANEYGKCGSLGLNNNPHNTKTSPCIIVVDVNGDRKPNPSEEYPTLRRDTPFYEGQVTNYIPNNRNFEYTFPSPSDKKLSDIFTILITDEKAIPFGVVAQRAMYSK